MNATVKPVPAWRRPLIVGGALSAMILGVLGVAGITGMIPGGNWDRASDAPQKALAREPIRTPLQQTKCPLCGTVESIRIVELRGAPADAGPVSGAAAAAQPIRREPSATGILETMAEAVTGTGSERKADKRLAYRVTVRMDDGSYRTVSQSSPPALAVGDKVRVVEGRLVGT